MRMNLDLTPHDQLCFQLRTFQPQKEELGCQFAKAASDAST